MSAVLRKQCRQSRPEPLGASKQISARSLDKVLSKQSLIETLNRDTELRINKDCDISDRTRSRIKVLYSPSNNEINMFIIMINKVKCKAM